MISSVVKGASTHYVILAAPIDPSYRQYPLDEYPYQIIDRTGRKEFLGRLYEPEATLKPNVKCVYCNAVCDVKLMSHYCTQY